MKKKLTYVKKYILYIVIFIYIFIYVKYENATHLKLVNGWLIILKCVPLKFSCFFSDVNFGGQIRK